MPATPQVARWFVDENSLGVAKALAYVRSAATSPGPEHPTARYPRAPQTRRGCLSSAGPGLVVLTRDKRIRSRPLERQALLAHNVRACFLTSGGSLTLFEQLRLWLRYWDDIETPTIEHPAPWLASVTQNGIRIFDSR